MRAVIIGGSGHYELILGFLKTLNIEIAGISGGCSGESTDNCLKDLASLGIRPKIYNEPLEMLEREKPDIAVINSYPGYNGELSCQALTRGISVYSEKPAAATTEGLRKLEKTYISAKERYAPYKKLCYSSMFGITKEPPFHAAEEAVKAGKIGDVRLCFAQKSYKLGKRDGYYSKRALSSGLIPWVSIHGIDWLYTVGGLRFKGVSATHSREFNGGNGELESTAACSFLCENGASAVVCSDYLRPSGAPTHGDDRLRLVGTRGIIEVSGGRAVLLCDKGETVLECKAPYDSSFEEFIASVCGKIEGDGSKNAFDVTRAALCARLSADKDGRFVLIK